MFATAFAQDHSCNSVARKCFPRFRIRERREADLEAAGVMWQEVCELKNAVTLNHAIEYGARCVVVSHPLGLREALGSIPSVSSLNGRDDEVFL